MKLTARTLARVETVRVLRRRGHSNAVIAERLGVTERTVTRYTVLARQHPAQHATATKTSWEKRAACRDYPAETFFLLSYQARREDVRAAKEICRNCPVMQECRAWALANPWWTFDGIWGAMTPPERRRARQAANTERTAAA